VNSYKYKTSLQLIVIKLSTFTAINYAATSNVCILKHWLQRCKTYVHLKSTL